MQAATEYVSLCVDDTVMLVMKLLLGSLLLMLKRIWFHYITRTDTQRLIRGIV